MSNTIINSLNKYVRSAIIISIATSHHWPLQQLNVKNAFLDGETYKKVKYMSNLAMLLKNLDCCVDVSLYDIHIGCLSLTA